MLCACQPDARYRCCKCHGRDRRRTTGSASLEGDRDRKTSGRGQSQQVRVVRIRIHLDCGRICRQRVRTRPGAYPRRALGRRYRHARVDAGPNAAPGRKDRPLGSDRSAHSPGGRRLGLGQRRARSDMAALGAELPARRRLDHGHRRPDLGRAGLVALCDLVVLKPIADARRRGAAATPSPSPPPEPWL